MDDPCPDYEYWAFISYSHRDKAWGDWLHHAVETCKVPARLFPVFRGRDGGTAQDRQVHARPRGGGSLESALRRRTAPGACFKVLPDGRVECFACGHRCKLKDGQAGVCRVRFCDKGKVMVPWGYVAGLQADPIEKKPFFHALPGARAMSFGMLGCNFTCSFCQNWLSSQAGRDPEAGQEVSRCSPRDIVRSAVESGCRVVASTYNEPLITAEWAVAIFEEARKAGLLCSFVSNGHATPEAIEYLRPWVDLFKVDLKCFSEGSYRKLMGGSLKIVLDAIGLLHAKGFWVEVVTLVIPGVNDTDEELGAIAQFLVSVSKDIPWHVTAYHRDYRMEGPEGTSASAVLKAAEIGRASGLRYVYAGNLPGPAGDWETTFCPGCQAPLVERRGYRVLSNRVAAQGPKGSCPKCRTEIAGVWN